MRSALSLTMCAYLAVAAAPALAVQSNYFIKLDGMDPGGRVADQRKETIEISSWQWGATRAQGKVEHEWKVEEGESAPPQPGAAKFGAVSGVHRDDSVGGSKKETVGGGQTQASKQNKLQELRARSVADIDQAPPPAEKRQHGWVTVSKPLDRGAVRVKVRFPWVGCRVGARYPALTLGGGNQSYELHDAVVTSCGVASSGSLPMEEVSFNYAKVKVRGWDPATKQE